MKKLLLKTKEKLINAKEKIMNIRKAYDYSKDILTRFLKADLTNFIKSEKGISYMKEFNVNNEEELKLKALHIYRELYTEEEYYSLKSLIKGNALKRVQNV